MKTKHYFDKILFLKLKRLNSIQLQENAKTFVTAKKCKDIYITLCQNVDTQGQQNTNFLC